MPDFILYLVTSWHLCLQHYKIILQLKDNYSLFGNRLETICGIFYLLSEVKCVSQ